MYKIKIIGTDSKHKINNNITLIAINKYRNLFSDQL